MKKIWGAVAFTAAFALQVPANAAIVVLPAGTFSIAAPTETFDTRALGIAAFVGGGDGGTYLGIGNVTNGDIANVSSAPFVGNAGIGQPGKDTTNYLSIGPGQTGPGDPQTITYSSVKSFFGLYWGSIDTYNTLDFYLGSVLQNHFTGGSLEPGLSATGCQTDSDCNRYVLFTGLTFDKVLLGSSGACGVNPCFFPFSTPAMEVDNIAAGVPEPATWALMLLGFAGIGFVAYRRTKKTSAAVAT
jgi:hypothetical protein